MEKVADVRCSRSQHIGMMGTLATTILPLIPPTPHTHTHVHRQAAHWHNTSTILAAYYPFGFAPQRFPENISRYRDTLSASQLSRNAPPWQAWWEKLDSVHAAHCAQCTLHIAKQMQCTLCTTKVNSRPISTPSRRRRLWLIAIANADCLATLIV